MAKVTKNFLKGKMNKDLDDRIVPQGEYRDALNIQSLTSEGDDVGAIQNLLGNENIFGYNEAGDRVSTLSAGQTVGSIVDNSTNCVYMMVADCARPSTYNPYGGLGVIDVTSSFSSLAVNPLLPSNAPGGVADFTSIGNAYIGKGVDEILKISPDNNVDQVLTECVLRDVYRVATGFWGCNTSVNHLFVWDASSIRVGMKVTVVDRDGIPFWGEDDIVVTAVSEDYDPANSIYPTVTLSHNCPQTIFSSDVYTQGLTAVFDAERVLNFNTSLEMENTADEEQFVSPTPVSNLITGINILESKYLLFTDNYSEPKKVNIYRSLAGTDQDLEKQLHSKLLITDVTSGQLKDVGFIEEEHITVIKQAPKAVLHYRYNTAVNEESHDFTNMYRWQPGGLRTVIIPPQEQQDLQNNDFQGDPQAYREFVKGIVTDAAYGGNPESKYLNVINLQALKNMWDDATAAGTLDSYTGGEIWHVGVFGANGYGSSTPNSDGKSVRLGGLDVNTVGYGAFDYGDLQNAQNITGIDLVDTLSLSNQEIQNTWGDQFSKLVGPANTPAWGVQGEAELMGFSAEEIQGIEESVPKFAASNGINYGITMEDLASPVRSGLPPAIDPLTNLPYNDPDVTPANRKNQWLRRFFLAQPAKNAVGFNIDNNSSYNNYAYETPNTQLGKFNNMYPIHVFEFWHDISTSGSYSGVNWPAYENPMRLWNSGDVVTFRDPLSQNSFTVKIIFSPTEHTDTLNGSGGDTKALAFVFKILDISIIDYTDAQEWRRFYGDLEEGTDVNGKDFFRFSYRYTYEDGEVSPIGPWTQPIFKGTPLRFTGQGENKGMRNRIKSVDLWDFVTPSMPKDVVGIDIIYKRDSDQNYYEILKLNSESTEWKLPGLSEGLKGYARVTKEYFGRVLPQDQTYRHWDNVPKRALGQELIANRLVYGNYVEGFNMVDSSGVPIETDIKVRSIRAANASYSTPVLSAKASRTYSVGVVYIDKHGREAPVLTGNEANFTIPKSEGIYGTRLQVEIRNNAPYWATHYKVFVKEPSTPHTNITLLSGAVNQLSGLVNDAPGDNMEITFLLGNYDKDKVNEGDTLLFLNGPSQRRYSVVKKSVGTAIGAFNSPFTYTGSNQSGTYTLSNPEDYTFIIVSADGALATQLDLNPNTPGQHLYANYPGSYQPTLGTWGQFYKNHQVSFNCEVLPPQTVDLDLWWESSGAIPIYINDENIRDYIKIGDPLTYRLTLNDTNFLEEKLAKHQQPSIQLVLNTISAPITKNPTDTIEITADDIPQGVFLAGETTSIGFTDRWSLATFRLRLKEHITGGQTTPIKLYNTTHPVPGNERSTSVIDLHFVNCVSQSSVIPLQEVRMNGSLSGNLMQKGVKASTIFSDTVENHKPNGLIWSGLYNSGSQVNELNQFNVGLPITKDISPRHGSIQKLHAKDTNLTTLCEDKVLNILANKDALYNADGNTNITASNAVLGQVTPYVGEFGISTNPESFANYGYRSYFVDKARGVVLRLSRDGLTTISSAGMKDWFLDNTQNSRSIIGSYDERKDEYNVTLHSPAITSKEAYTISFSERAGGWVSFKSFTPEAQGVSLNSEYYTFMNGNIWQHHREKKADGSDLSFNNFYDVQYKSTITVIINQQPSVSKEFKTLFYDGDLGWAVIGNIETDIDQGHIGNNFKRTNNKHYDYIKGGDKYNNISNEWANAAYQGYGQFASGTIDFSSKNVYGIGKAKAVNLAEGETELVNQLKQFWINTTT